jgi:hypothetical protein
MLDPILDGRTGRHRKTQQRDRGEAGGGRSGRGMRGTSRGASNGTNHNALSRSIAQTPTTSNGS